MKPSLRLYQQDAVDAILKDMESPKPSKGIGVLGTGTGKSFCIAGLAKSYKDPILVLQPSKELLEQNFNKFKLLGGEASIYSASFNIKEIGHVTFGTLGSVIKAIDEFKKLKNLLVICDEAHYKYSPDPGSQFRRFMDEVKPKYSYGLTATPFRMYSSMAGAMLKMIIRTRPRYFNKILYVQQISEAIDLGFWAPSIDERWAYDDNILKLNTTGSDYTDQSIKKANEYNSVNRSISVRLLELIAENKRKSILVFTDSVENAKVFAKYFENHTTVGVVHGGTSKKERKSLVKGFKSGEIKILFNYGIFTTGFDHPELDTIIMGRPTNSLMMFYQIYGRGVRVIEGKENFLFIDCCDNFGRLCHPRDIVIEEDPVIGWGVFANDKVVTGVPIGGPPVYKHELIQAKQPANDLGKMPFGKWKNRSIETMCERDMGYAQYMSGVIDTEQYGPGLKNRIEEGIKRVSLKGLLSPA